MNVGKMIEDALARCPELFSSGKTTELRRGVEPVHTFLYLPKSGAHFTTKGNINLMLALCPSGWWIVGEDYEDDDRWEDRGPFDAFETAYAILKLLAK